MSDLPTATFPEACSWSTVPMAMFPEVCFWELSYVNVPTVESFHGRGCSFCAKMSLGDWVPHVRLPVNEEISRVQYIFGLRHWSLVGLCERMPSTSFLRWYIEFLMWGAQGLSAATLSWDGSVVNLKSYSTNVATRYLFRRIYFITLHYSYVLHVPAVGYD